MGLSRKLQKWVDAGLVSATQKDDILTFEKTQTSARWKFGLGMAGLLSILLGIALIVAANWQDIPDAHKLCLHFAINTGLAFLVWQWRDNPAREAHREWALFGLWGLTLTLIALIGQIFQLGGQAYEALRLWFWLTTPMILLFANSSYTTRLWAIAFVLYVPYDIISFTWDWTENWNIRKAALIETAIGVPLGAWLLGAWPRLQNARPEMATTLRGLGVLLALFAASIAGIEFYDDFDYGYSLLVPAFYAAAAIGLRFLIQRARDWSEEDRATIDVLCLAGLFVCLPFLASVTSSVMALLHFLLFWILAGWIWQQAGHDRLVSLAIFAITARLFIGFLELFGSMMMSGFGFIVIGVVLLGLLKAARMVNTRLKGSDA